MSSFNPVKPGDLITAAFFNQVLSDFDDRISKLEAASGLPGGKMLITGLSPATTLHMGDQLTVLGQNFGLPSQAVVTIDSARVDGSSFLPGSGNNALIFQIPPVQGVPPEGKVVNLAVSNPTSATPPFPFTLFPFVLTIPTGQLFVNMTAPPAVGSITPNNSYIFVFTITSDTSLPDTYVLNATLDPASSAASWTATPVNPDLGTTITQVQIPAGQKIATRVGVKVTIPAVAGVTTAQVNLTASSALNPAGITNSGSATIKVGAAPPPPNAISINIVGVSATGLPGATFSGNSISLPHGATSGVLAVNALCPTADTYNSIDPTFDAAGWAGSVTPSKKEFPTTGANQTVLIQINLTTIPAGPASTTLHFTVKSKTQSNVTGQISPTISVA